MAHVHEDAPRCRHDRSLVSCVPCSNAYTALASHRPSKAADAARIAKAKIKAMAEAVEQRMVEQTWSMIIPKKASKTMELTKPTCPHGCLPALCFKCAPDTAALCQHGFVDKANCLRCTQRPPASAPMAHVGPTSIELKDVGTREAFDLLHGITVAAKSSEKERVLEMTNLSLSHPSPNDATTLVDGNAAHLRIGLGDGRTLVVRGDPRQTFREFMLTLVEMSGIECEVEGG